jgi:hypothetical protein
MLEGTCGAKTDEINSGNSGWWFLGFSFRSVYATPNYPN